MVRALARVDLGAISANCARLASLAPLCAVVKADGYGHGAAEAARAAQAGGASWLAVATAQEAAGLRAAGIAGPLLVMGALSPEELPVAVEAGADVVAWCEDFVRRVPDHIGVHVKLDTGMGRLGTRDPGEATRVAEAAGSRLAGVMTHFATADDDPAFMAEQLARFVAWSDGFPGVMRHAANSAAALRAPEARLDLIRCGIAIYGMDPFHCDPAEHGLRPALELVSYVAAVKHARPGESVGYGRRFVAERETWLATVPIGYGDGVRRGLTNRADALVGGRRVPFAGTVSMDNIVLDLGDQPVQNGTEVVLLGARGGERILAEEWAAALGTINYEITCGITARVPRAYEPWPSDALAAAREALAGERAWLVGGAVRDHLLGRETDDVDIVLDGDPRAFARQIARATGGASFQLSGEFGAWRVVGPDHAWHADLVTLRAGDIEADLAQRDFTINAMAEPLEGGDLLDPHGGREDLARRVVRMVSAHALADDPLRSLRAVRLAVELGLEIDPDTGRAAAEHASGIERVAAERVLGELKRVVAADAARRGLELMSAYGLTAVVLPELEALRGVEQSVFHHLDVHDHTLEVLDAVAQLQRDPAAAGLDADVAALLAEPFSDEITRGTAMRFAALMHDAAKPRTRGLRPDGRVTFIGHDAEGAKLAREALGRLRSSQRLRDYVAALTAHHLDLGFLVHSRPLDRRATFRYLNATAPFSADVTIFTVADRLSTRGRNADAAISAHVELARAMLAAEPPGPPLVRGDELAAELGVRPGPELGRLLAVLAEDQYAGEVTTRADALARARELLAGPSRRGCPWSG